MKPNQAKDLTHFVNAFVKNLEEHSVCERKKYPERYDIPEPSDVILDDAIVRKILPTISRWRSKLWCPSGTCSILPNGYTCKCKTLPQEERLMSAFLRNPFEEPENQLESNQDAHFNFNIVQTGDGSNITHLCPPWCASGVLPWDIGWRQLCQHMLSVYICLNVAYCFPELWDSASGRTKAKGYRNARFYQKTLIEIGTARCGNFRKFPHSQFFGTDFCKDRVSGSPGNRVHWLFKEEYNTSLRKGGKPVRGSYGYWNYRSKDNLPGDYGRVPIREFLSLRLPDLPSYDPSLSETEDVCIMLCSMGLPVELALDIMEFAAYKPPKSKLNIPHDPLHPVNREALGKHLKYCWQTMVRCYTIATELGMEPLESNMGHEGMNWRNIVGNTIIDLFGHHKDQGSQHWLDLEFSDKCLPRIWYNKYTVLDDHATYG